MKTNTRFSTAGLAVALLMAGTCFAEGVTPQAGGAPPGDAAKETPETRTRAAASNFLPIVRGRLPLVFVHAIRFDKVLTAMGNKDLSSKFATSVGKVFDIKKGRNFAYVNAEFKPTAEDITAAEAWIAQVGGENAKGLKTSGDTKLMEQVLKTYKDAGLATAEQAAAFTAARGATRKTSAPADGTAAVGDASKAKGKGKTETVQAAGKATADLLS